MLNTKTLGILGGMGPAATANFMRQIVEEFNAKGIYTDSGFPRIIVLSVPLKEWDNRGATNKNIVWAQIQDGLEWLREAGADIIAVPCNTVHEFISYGSVVDIVDEALKLCAPTGTLGVLCSAQTRESKLYERRGHPVKYYPLQSSVDDVIASVMAGISVDIGFMINAEFKDCVNIILGCTELSLCSVSSNMAKNVIDSSSALAKAVVKRMM